MGNNNSGPATRGNQARGRVQQPHHSVPQAEKDEWVHEQRQPSIRSGIVPAFSSKSDELQLENGNTSDLAEILSEDKVYGDVDGIEEDEEPAEGGPGEGTGVSSTPLSTDQNVSIKLKVYKSSDVKIESTIGEGEFGKVSKATLQGKIKATVAIKVFFAPFEGENTNSRLNAIMKLKHRNVVQVLGILDSPANSFYGPRVILHYFPEGNMLQFLSKPNNPQDYATLVKLALDVVQGCDYLHSRNVIHGNLAARNILVEKQRGKVLTHYNAKVSDHGIIQLARAKGCGKNYLRVGNSDTLPIRWIPKELLDENNTGFTFASDVWSFGVTLWECLTKGAVPFGRKKEEPKVMELIKLGLSPLDIRVPEISTHEMTLIMKRIFSVNPETRPTFAELRKDIGILSVKLKFPETTNKVSLESSKDDQSVPETKKYESMVDIGHKPPETGNVFGSPSHNLRGRRPRGRRGSDGSGRLFEKAGTSSTSANSSSQGASSRPDYGRGRGGHGPRYGPPISSFHAMNHNPNVGQPYAVSNPENMSTPPPPYTPNPLPNHSAFGSSSRGATAGSGLVGFTTRQQNEQRKVNYAREIKRKEQELEQLRIQKLRQDATDAWGKMHTILHELNELKAVPPPLLSGAGATAVGSNDMRNSSRDQSHVGRSRGGGAASRGSKPSSSRGHGRGRSQSKGRNQDSSKLTPATSFHNIQSLF